MWNWSQVSNRTENPIDDNSTLVQVMAWCPQLSQWCPKYVSPYGVIMSQWVNLIRHKIRTSNRLNRWWISWKYCFILSDQSLVQNAALKNMGCTIDCEMDRNALRLNGNINRKQSLMAYLKNRLKRSTEHVTVEKWWKHLKVVFWVSVEIFVIYSKHHVFPITVKQSKDSYLFQTWI